MRTTKQWIKLHKSNRTTTDWIMEFYRTVNEEAEGIGHRYATGQISHEMLALWLRTVGSTWPFTRRKADISLSSGMIRAIQDGTAIASRLQPEQKEVIDET